jgi:hypothetical protein
MGWKVQLKMEKHKREKESLERGLYLKAGKC